jgi:amino acid adenylation domain-containing protein
MNLNHKLDLTPIVLISRNGDLPLSTTQSRMWIFTQFEEGIAYNIPLAFRIEGQLNTTALEQSLTEIVRRHEALRTIFPVLEGVPMQRILPPAPVPLPRIQLSDSGTDIESQIHHLTQQEAQRPFHLSQEIPLRTTLLQLGEQTHILMLTIHHIAADGWSLEVWQRELSTLYTAYCQNAPSPLVELPIQYADFAHWQEEWLKGEVISQQLTYWQQQLAEMPPLLELPTDRPRPPIQSFQGETEFFTISPELTHQLKALGQQNGATLFMTILGAFAVLLSRYSRQSQVVIGSPVANRNRPEIEPLIGFFINLLALPIELSGNPTFLELLQRVRQTSLNAYAHQELPFNQLVEALQPARNQSHSPLFQVMFVLQNAPGEPLQLPDLNITSLPIETGTTKYDLTLILTETASGMMAELEYSSVLFDRSTMQRFIGHLLVLLEGIVSNPQARLSDLPILTAAEQHQLLVEWNDTQVSYPQDQCIHQLFEQQVERTPDAIAVVFEGTKLTYRELNNRANQLAHYLQSLGVKPDSLVGISVNRSLEMVIGLLAILKAGGAYVPLDPSYPADRVAYILSNSEANCLLTTSDLLATLPQEETRFICLDTEWAVISQQPESNPDSEVKPDNLSYVIFTSGSTGKPKGVQICHQSLVNFITSMQHEPGLMAGDRLLAVTTISFDIHTLEMYLPLSVGATIILASRDMTIDGRQLINEMSKYDVNVMQATPATWRMLLLSDWQGSPNLKVICGGEAMPRELANRLLAKVGVLWNIYGPTETTVWSTAYQVTASRPSANEDAPESIGRPIANTQTYVLDSLLQPVPIGVIGELYIGGDGVARGYLKRPDLNAASFLANPFKSDSRIYKTGDLARYLPDGNIEYLGRIDNQVKIRGFRIEIGEIENVLDKHPDVEQGVVVVREDAPGNKQLVAYFVVSGQSSPSIQELRQFLKVSLPDYMIPAVFVMLEALPLTPNGKVDRRALPAPDNVRSDAEKTFVAPRNELEIQLINIWQNVLGIQPIGIDDNFFELGGNSFIALRLMAEIEKISGKNLPLSLLFQKQTIAGFADVLSQEGWSPSWSSLVPMKTKGSQTPLFLFHAIGGNLLDYKKLINYLDQDRPIYGLQSVGLDGKQDPLATVEAMVTHYINEIQTIQPQGPYFLFGYSFGGIIAFEMAQQLSAKGEKIAWLGICDKDVPDQNDEQQNQSEFARFVKLHTTNIGKISSFKGKLKYIWDRGLTKIRGLKSKFENIVYDVDYDKYVAKELSKNQFSDHDFLLKLLDVNMQAHVNYRANVYSGSLNLFRCKDQHAKYYFTPDLGWGDVVTEGVEIYHIPGRHFDLMKEPLVQVLAKELNESLKIRSST